MQKAYLVINESERKLVDADNVEHSDYSKIFQCPRCNATLTLREGYFRNSYWVSATFVHPEGDPSDCALRVTFNASSSSQPIFDLIERGQSSKKLEQAFLKCFRYYKSERRSVLEKYLPGLAMSFMNDELHLKRQISYNVEPGKVYSDPALLIRASSSILKSGQYKQYIEREIGKFEEWLKSSQQAIDYFSEREKQKGGNLSLDNIVKYHCRQLIGITKYIRQGASEDFRQEFLKIIIWGDQKLPVSVKNLWTNQELKKAEQRRKWLGEEREDWEDYTRKIEQKRKSQIELIKKFSTHSLKRICEEPQFLRDSFLDFYQSGSSASSEFIGFVLSKTLESIKLYDWSALPNFYS